MCDIRGVMMKMIISRTTATMFLAVFLSASFSSALASSSSDLPHLASDIGLLINFSVPCDLNSAIAVPDQGGLLTPVLLGVGYQGYRYDGSKWTLIDQHANLFNKSLVQVGTLFATSPSTAGAGSVTFKLFPSTRYGSSATVTATPTVSVRQAFAIPLQLLSTTSAVNQSAYSSSDYIQRFGTQAGLPPGASYSANAKAGDTFNSRFSAFYAFFLPRDLSPQLATRVPRCGDERFHGLQYGRDFP